MPEKIKMSGLVVGGILPLSNPEVANFANEMKGKDYVSGPPAPGEKSPLEILLEEQKANLYLHIMPEDINAMWLPPNNEALLKGKRGYAEVYTDPTKMVNGTPHPDHTIVFYFAVDQIDAHTLDKELVLSYVGTNANILMVHRNSCCEEYSVTVEAQTRGRPIRSTLDSINTMGECQGLFLDETGNSKFIRMPSVEDANLMIADDPSLEEPIKVMRSDFVHAITHAASHKHNCSSFKVEGPKHRHS